MFNRKKRIIELEKQVAILSTKVDHMAHDVERNLDRFNLSMGRVGHHLSGKVCPECRSENYIDSPVGKAHCFDCGYPLIQGSTNMVNLGN